MKCWKCGADIPSGTSVCTYCSASMTRKNTVTNAGKAMRQVYDHFGCAKVFEKQSILPVALGDLLDDSKKLRTQIDMAMSCGIGTVYINQLRNVGKPDATFCTRIKTLMTEDAGLSDKTATELMGYFDEMIGWAVPVQSTTQTSPNTAYRPNPNKEIPRPNPYKETSRSTPNKEIPRPTPNPTPPPTDPVKPPVNEPEFPLPTVSVPSYPKASPSDSFWCLLFFGGAIGLLCAGLIPFAIISGIAYLIVCHNISVKEKGIVKRVTYRRWDTGIQVNWNGELRYAIAVDKKWVLTGTGETAMLKADLFSKYKSGDKFRITLAYAPPAGGIDFRGKVELRVPEGGIREFK